MALGVPFPEFIQMIGHDGSDKPYRDKTWRRGFHAQECIDIASRLGVSCTPIELHFASTPDGGEIFPVISTVEARKARFMQYLEDTSKGVIEGLSLKNTKPVGHAVAWLSQQVYDPRGKIYLFKDRLEHNFTAVKLWRLVW